MKAHNYCSHIWQISPVTVSLWWCSKSHPMCSWNCYASLLFYSVREPLSVVVARKTWIIDYITGPYPPHPPHHNITESSQMSCARSATVSQINRSQINVYVALRGNCMRVTS